MFLKQGGLAGTAFFPYDFLYSFAFLCWSYSLVEPLKSVYSGIPRTLPKLTTSLKNIQTSWPACGPYLISRGT